MCREAYFFCYTVHLHRQPSSPRISADEMTLYWLAVECCCSVISVEVFTKYSAKNKGRKIHLRNDGRGSQPRSRLAAEKRGRSVVVLNNNNHDAKDGGIKSLFS